MWVVDLAELRSLVDHAFEPGAAVDWTTTDLPVITRTDRVTPAASGALDLVIGHSRIDDVDDAGIVLGVGDPATCIVWIPDCGCDACDNGSQNELDHLDTHIVGIITGAFRRLTRGRRSITVTGDGGWSAHGFRSRGGRDVESVLANPRGWHELAGASWLAPAT